MTCLTSLGICGGQPTSEIAEQNPLHHWRIPARNLQVAFKIPYIYDFFYKTMRAAGRNHTES
jgi:hypothetical protein